MIHLPIDEDKIQETDENDRFKRPISVAIFGCLISAGMVALVFVRADPTQSGSGIIGLVGFILFAFAFSIAYAYIGWRWSSALAHRILGIVGGVVVVSGLAFLFWILLAKGSGNDVMPIRVPNPMRHHVDVEQPQ